MVTVFNQSNKAILDIATDNMAEAMKQLEAVLNTANVFEYNRRFTGSEMASITTINNNRVVFTLVLQK